MCVRGGFLLANAAGKVLNDFVDIAAGPHAMPQARPQRATPPTTDSESER
jgi:hypothetical protein